MCNNLYVKLKPKNYGTFKVEPFDVYKERIEHLLPKWPESALYDWLYRHYDFAIDDYGWLGFHNFLFKKELWNSKKIIEEINSHRMKTIDSLGQRVKENRSWLQKKCLKTKHGHHQ